MPVGTVSTEPRHFDLKSAPPDGFVTLRQQSYGERMERQDIVVRMTTETGSDSPDGAIRIGGEKVTWEMANFATSLFDFQKSVVDHNITDASGRKLNLATAYDLRQLDPRIGEEIEGHIRELNTFTDEDKERFQGRGPLAGLESGDAQARAGADPQGSGDPGLLSDDEHATRSGRSA